MWFVVLLYTVMCVLCVCEWAYMPRVMCGAPTTGDSPHLPTLFGDKASARLSSLSLPCISLKSSGVTAALGVGSCFYVGYRKSRLMSSDKYCTQQAISLPVVYCCVPPCCLPHSLNWYRNIYVKTSELFVCGGVEG